MKPRFDLYFRVVYWVRLQGFLGFQVLPVVLGATLCRGMALTHKHVVPAAAIATGVWCMLLPLTPPFLEVIFLMCHATSFSPRRTHCFFRF